MKPNTSSSGINRRALLSTLAVLPALSGMLLPISALAQAKRAAGSAFSFAVYGDSRSMMYLPYKSNQREEAIKLMVDMFELVLPEKVAEAVVRRDVKLIYDPATDELAQIVMPFESKSEVTTLTVDKGWVTEASVRSLDLSRRTQRGSTRPELPSRPGELHPEPLTEPDLTLASSGSCDRAKAAAFH